MRNRSLVLSVCALLLGATPSLASAQASDTVGVAERSGSMNVSIPVVLHLSANGLAVNFDSPTEADFNNGTLGASSGTTITHGANVPHDVQIEAASEYMLDATGNPTTKPASDLQWSSGGAYSSLALGTPGVVVSDAAAGFHQNGAEIDYQMLLDWSTDQPGEYTLGYTLTIVAD